MAPSITKLCAPHKPPIARLTSHSFAMAKKTLNQLLGENLASLMSKHELSDKKLGQMDGVAPSTSATPKPAPSGLTFVLAAQNFA